MMRLLSFRRRAKLGLFSGLLVVGAALANKQVPASVSARPISGDSRGPTIGPTPDGGSVVKILVEAGTSRRLYASLYSSWLYVLNESRWATYWKASVPPGTIPGTHSIYSGDKTFSDLYLWMATHSSGYYGIFHSRDHAVSWQVVPPPNTHSPMAFAVSPSSPPTIYWATGWTSDFIFSSSDNGQSWAPLSKGPTGVTMLFTAPSQPAVVLAYGSGGTLFRSEDSGSSWTSLPGAPVPDPGGENTFAVDPTDSSRLYLGGTGGVYRSTDGGVSWTKSANGFTQFSPSAGAIAVDPLKPNVLLAFGYQVTNTSLYRSEDSGETWTPLGGNAPQSIDCITFDPLDDNIIYLGTALDGVVRSLDGGQTWSPYDAGLANAPVGFMSAPRLGRHTVTLLNDGTALVAGGDAAGGGSGSISLCERFDPRTNLFSQTASMSVPREDHTATLLQDGHVLVAGGIFSHFVGADFLNSTEIYDPVSETWAASANMQFSRIDSTATLLPNGRVLIIGGEVFSPSAGSVGEIFDPTTISFTPAAALPVALHVHTATALADGLVLVTFGGQETASSTSVLLYDYRVDQWIQPQPSPMALDSPVATRLNDGRMLIAEGLQSEIFDPSTRRFWSSGRPVFDIGYPSRAVALDDGRVYVCCGYNGAYSSSLTQIYDPSSASFEPGPETALQRTGAVPVKLNDGRVLIVGGAGNYLFETPEISAEEYLPDIPLSFILAPRPRTLGWRTAR